MIPEGDIYRLIIKAADQSRNSAIKEKAERFERWVFDEVLPSIRKHGAYMADASIDRLLANADLITELAAALKAERAKRLELDAQMDQVRQEAQAAVNFRPEDSTIAAFFRECAVDRPRPGKMEDGITKGMSYLVYKAWSRSKKGCDEGKTAFHLFASKDPWLGQVSRTATCRFYANWTCAQEAESLCGAGKD
jgi:hypothetical protein